MSPNAKIWLIRALSVLVLPLAALLVLLYVLFDAIHTVAAGGQRSLFEAFKEGSAELIYLYQTIWTMDDRPLEDDE